MKNDIENYVKGFVVGDAMGVPYEFCDREEMETNPCTTMVGYGTYNQPKGTWSDDTSMLLATMDGILKDDVDFEKIMDNFVKWYKKGAYTPHKNTFDIGNTTRKALTRYINGEDIVTCGLKDENACGNGSLMRIAPITFFLRSRFGNDFWTNKLAFDYIAGLSELTHANMKCIISCGFYVSIMNEILNDKKKNLSKVELVQNACKKVFKVKGFGISDDIECFEDFLDIEKFARKKKQNINSSGYVIDTIECCIWLFLSSSSAKECVLNAINMGEDTDTIAALSGGLYNLYEHDEDVETYYEEIQNKELLEKVVSRFEKKIV